MSAPARRSIDSANALLNRLIEAADDGAVVGFMHEIGADLGYSATRSSRALSMLVEANRVEIAQRGHGLHRTRIRIVDPSPLEPVDNGSAPLADRLLHHLHGLSDDGVVEQPLVDVARDLEVGPPSVSRALSQLVDSGLARVDRIGTRSRPTRIELAPDNSDEGDILREIARHEEALAQARSRLAALRSDSDRDSDSGRAS